MPKPLVIFFSAGDPSGDLHAANLIRQLRRRSGICKPWAMAGRTWRRPAADCTPI